MARAIIPNVDLLFVEGPDDGAVVNALAARDLGVDLVRPRLVKVSEEGGGDDWALREFVKRVGTAQPNARVGLIVDRDQPENDKWPSVRERLRKLGHQLPAPSASGAIVDTRFGIWMWPDNVSHGSLEDFVEAIVPDSPLFAHAREATRTARESHGAEYRPPHERKAVLKVRSVWRDASAAGGYGHLVRNLTLNDTSARTAFIAWFETLFLKE